MKFIVDGEWKCSKFFETVHDDDGNLNNILVVEPVTNVDDEETCFAQIFSGSSKQRGTI